MSQFSWSFHEIPSVSIRISNEKCETTPLSSLKFAIILLRKIPPLAIYPALIFTPDDVRPFLFFDMASLLFFLIFLSVIGSYFLIFGLNTCCMSLYKCKEEFLLLLLFFTATELLGERYFK